MVPADVLSAWIGWGRNPLRPAAYRAYHAKQAVPAAKSRQTARYFSKKNFNYSYRSASIGSDLAAFDAG